MDCRSPGRLAQALQRERQGRSLSAREMHMHSRNTPLVATIALGALALAANAYAVLSGALLPLHRFIN